MNASWLRTSFVLIVLVVTSFFTFSTAQSNDEELIEARKRAVELVGNTPVPPEFLACIASGDIHSRDIFFPEGKANEVYTFDNGLGYAYFKIENDKAVFAWTGDYPVAPTEGKKVNDTNTYANFWLSNSLMNYGQSDFVFEEPSMVFHTECGSLPTYEGKLEVFGTISLREAYKGVVKPNGDFECRITLSETLEPGPMLGQYEYGVANCDEKQ
jgi:hypothetical protein